MGSDDSPPLSPFRQRIENAFRRRLLSSDYFGRVCDWNGRELQITEGASPGWSEQAGPDGKIPGFKTIACLQSDLQPPPVGGSGVMLDGEKWVIVDVQKPFAHYLITLRRYTS